MTDSLTRLTAEEKLLLSLCRLEFSQEQKSEIRELMLEVRDWDRFVGLSNEHGIIALCWYNLTETGNTDHIPAGHLDKMHSAYLKNLTRDTFLNNQLEEVTNLAKKENIKIVLLKGMALEKTIYGSRGLRQMTDIDILVRQDQAALLRRILLKNGYESAPLVSKFHEKIMPVYGKHLPEMYKNGIAVEIHFNLFDQSGNYFTEKFFDKAHWLTDDDTNLMYPDPQMFFLYLLKHLDRHEKEGDSQLRLYVDLVLLLTTHYNEVINENLFNDADSVNLRNILAGKIMLLDKYWDITFSDQVRQNISAIKSASVESKFLKLIRHQSGNQREEIKENLFQLLQNVPGAMNKFLLIIGHIFPSVSYVRYRYKIKTKAGAVLYYPVRWIRQAGRLIGVKV